MKKCLYLLFSISLSFVSCINTQKSEIEKQAVEAFKMSYAKEVKDANFDSFRTVFFTQNLCIIHIEGNVANAPKKLEYLFFTQDGKNYEAVQDLSEDSIFVSEPTLKTISKGTIYEKLDFANATFYRAALYINSFGREVGNHNTDFILRIPMETGLWELCGFVDEFGDKINGKYLRITGKGKFSKTLETNEKLIALLFIDEYHNCCLRLVEYGYGVVKDFSGYIKIKDGEGDVHEIYFSESSSGNIEPNSLATKMEFRDIVEKEGELSAIANIGGGLFSEKKSYKFKFNLNGLKKAMNYVWHNENNASESDYEEVDSNIESFNNEDIDDDTDISIPESESINELIDSI